jgi:hypothetical protein
VRALKRESRRAIQYWWGVGPRAVRNWRKAVGAKKWTDGARDTIRDYTATLCYRASLQKAWSKNSDPVRCSRISVAQRGRKFPHEVRAKISRSKTGRKATPEQRTRQSERYKLLGIRPPWIGPPWTIEEDAAARSLPPRMAASKTGRSLYAVYMRRQRLSVKSRSRDRRNMRGGARLHPATKMR